MDIDVLPLPPTSPTLESIYPRKQRTQYQAQLVDEYTEELMDYFGQQDNPRKIRFLLGTMIDKAILPFLEVIPEIARLHRDQYLQLQANQERSMVAQQQSMVAQQQSIVAQQRTINDLVTKVDNLPNQLQSQQLLISTVSPFRGSLTRAKAFAEAMKRSTTKLEVPLPDAAVAAVNSKGDSDTSEGQIAGELESLARGEETDIDHRAVATCITAFLSDKTAPQFIGNTHVVDTHSERFLNDLAPDISIQRYTSTADKFNVAAIIELKGADKKLGTLDNFGQVLDYLVELAICQPGRAVFVGVLTNLKDAYVLKYTQGIAKGRNRRTSTDTSGLTSRLTQFRKASLQDALRYLALELQRPAANPPKLRFTQAVGKLVRIIQRHSQSHSVVGEFTHNGINVIGKAASDPKWRGALHLEIETLRKLQGGGRPISIPELRYPLADSETPIPPVPEMVIFPVGRPLQLDLFSNAADFRACLEDILFAIAWVHAHGIVHRDVRTDNVLVHAAKFATSDHSTTECSRQPLWRGLLIDFDHATLLGQDCEYEGGYICCPVEVLKACAVNGFPDLDPTNDDVDLQMLDSLPDCAPEFVGAEFDLGTPLYTPRMSHDYLAFVLLVNTLNFPFTLQGFSYNRVLRKNSPERDRLLRLWDSLRHSPGWRDMVALADQAVADVAAWREVLTFISWL
ncbi:hypothetical protein EV426DRAFT_720872 [Tirmania nivea]|nr:hypothetical protein EV426DRAFT_720872 [Tirmania nivea]